MGHCGRVVEEGHPDQVVLGHCGSVVEEVLPDQVVLLVLFLCSPARSLGFTIWGEIFA